MIKMCFPCINLKRVRLDFLIEFGCVKQESCGVQKKEEGEERVGVGSRGKYPGAPPHHIGKKRRKKPTARYLIGP
jgi:hypothetical protein